MRVHIEANQVVQEALSKPYRRSRIGNDTVVFICGAVVIAAYLIWIGWSSYE